MPIGANAPMPGTIRVEILPASDGVGREPAVLRDDVRDALLTRLGETGVAELAAAPARAR